MNHQKLYKYLSILTLGCSSALCIALPAKAAERLSFFTSIGEFTIPVASLETFAKEGEIDSELAFFAKFFSPERKTQLRGLLQQRLDFSHVKVANFLYSSMGKISLDYLGEYIQTDAHQNGFYALRAALILSAADREGLSLINILKKYPSASIRVNPNALFQIFNNLAQLQQKTNLVTALIEKQSQIESNSETIEVDSEEKIDLQLGSFKVQKQILALYDRKRKGRSFLTDLYLPQNTYSAPVLIISHGAGSDKSDFVYLAQHLASHGFAVAVPQHPGSDRRLLEIFFQGGAKDIIEANEFIDRPLDISFLLDELERLNQYRPDIQDRLNLQKVGILGHSFGGYTALMLAGAEANLSLLKQECRVDKFNLNVGNTSHLLQCLALNLPKNSLTPLQDKRVKAVFAINPVGAGIFGEKGLRKIQIPTMFVASSNDAVAPIILEQLCPFTWLKNKNKYLAFIQNGTHSDANKKLSKNNLPLVDQLTSPNPELARSYLNVMSLAFAKTYVSDDDKYHFYLQNKYVRTISQSPMPLTLIYSLTANLLSQQLQLSCPVKIGE
jgi:predicted dienelactone hydrolase